ncbi:hypothetical protein Plhal304r1_c052g0136231 [Plasmopara halstedii]
MSIHSCSLNKPLLDTQCFTFIAPTTCNSQNLTTRRLIGDASSTPCIVIMCYITSKWKRARYFVVNLLPWLHREYHTTPMREQQLLSAPTLILNQRRLADFGEIISNNLDYHLVL